MGYITHTVSYSTVSARYYMSGGVAGWNIKEHELEDGGEGQGVGSVGPEVAERAET